MQIDRTGSQALLARPVAMPAPLAARVMTPPLSQIVTASPLQPIGSPGRQWQEAAAKRAGFDLATWNPERGFTANKQYVWGAYNYYRQMQIEHPALEWSGMAYGIGPTFAAGLQDLAVFNRYAAVLERNTSLLPEPEQEAIEVAKALAGTSTISRVSGDLERELLTMQQAIFLDQGMQHEAYLGGGMRAIRQLARSGAIDDHAADAWQQINDGMRSGDRAKIESGNLELLRREQMQTIAANYDHIRQLTLVSPLVTYLLTALGRPSIPGSKRPGQVVPIQIGPIRLPIPAMDISRADDRWRVIERDTWPAFARLINEHPVDYQRMLTTPLDDRIAAGRFRYLPDSASFRDVAKYLANIVRHRR